jgi:hypothetical protein
MWCWNDVGRGGGVSTNWINLDKFYCIEGKRQEGMERRVGGLLRNSVYKRSSLWKKVKKPMINGNGQNFKKSSCISFS